jgi:hypothetical protein
MLAGFADGDRLLDGQIFASLGQLLRGASADQQSGWRRERHHGIPSENYHVRSWECVVPVRPSSYSSATSTARVSKRANPFRNVSGRSPMGPLRCLDAGRARADVRACAWQISRQREQRNLGPAPETGGVQAADAGGDVQPAAFPLVEVAHVALVADRRERSERWSTRTGSPPRPSGTVWRVTFSHHGSTKRIHPAAPEAVAKQPRKKRRRVIERG